MFGVSGDVVIFSLKVLGPVLYHLIRKIDQMWAKSFGTSHYIILQ